MRTEELYYLIDLAKTKSINRTAERVHISQPAISKSLNKLEAELGVKLFFRSYQGVYLTEAGELVVEMAHEILNTIDKYKVKLNAFLDESSLLSENLSISAVPAISNGILLDIFFIIIRLNRFLIVRASVNYIFIFINAKAAIT
jgi:LysR family transcriptional activator of glutamate synthase operon